MNTSATQSLVRTSSTSQFRFLQGASKVFHQLGRVWKRCLPTVEFGRSVGGAGHPYRRAALLAAVRGNPEAAKRLDAVARAIGGGR